METSKVINRNLIEISEEGTVVITEQFLNQVKYLCSQISAVEWSGLVFFKTKGSPQKLSTFKVIPEYIHLMHKGNSTYTEFDDDGSLVELHKLKPEFDPFEDTEYKYGKIHSHNTMQVFHSATDTQDLQDQAGAYEYYLSIIVNNFMDIEAKIAFVANIPAQRINPARFKGMKWELPTEEVLGVIDLEVENESSTISIPQELKDRTEVVIEEAKVKPINKNLPAVGGYGREWKGMGLDYIDEEDDEIIVRDMIRGSEFTTTLADKGETLILDFLRKYFKNQISTHNLFDTVEDLPLNAYNILIVETEKWSRGLADISMESLGVYLTENTEVEDDSTQLYTYFSSIWNMLAAKEVKDTL